MLQAKFLNDTCLIKKLVLHDLFLCAVDYPRRIFNSLFCLVLLLVPLLGISQQNSNPPDTVLTMEVGTDIQSILGEARTINSLPLKAVKTVTGKDSSGSVKKNFTKTFYSTTKRKLLKAIIHETHTTKSPATKTTITQTYYFKDENLIYLFEKKSGATRSVSEAFFRNGQALAITKSSMDAEYISRANRLLKEFK